MTINKESTHKELVAEATAKALRDIGKPIYNIMVAKLQSQYRCQLSDCYEHPEYLNVILDDLYGQARRAVVKSINRDLQKITKDKTIERFLVVINQ